MDFVRNRSRTVLSKKAVNNSRRKIRSIFEVSALWSQLKKELFGYEMYLHLVLGVHVYFFVENV